MTEKQYADTLRYYAVQYECAEFTDMTLDDYPEILHVVDEWGQGGNPTVEVAEFYELTEETARLHGCDNYDKGTFGFTRARQKKEKEGEEEVSPSIGVVRTGNLEELHQTLAHEMIHHLENELNNLNEAYCQYLTVKLWEKLSPMTPDLERRVLEHLEYSKLTNMEKECGQHDMLFLLKSYDIDLANGWTLGTTFGYHDVSDGTD